jgi:hypothetical protein
MEPDDNKDVETAPPTANATQPVAPTLDLRFSEAELSEISASLDPEMVSLLNLC